MAAGITSERNRTIRGAHALNEMRILRAVAPSPALLVALREAGWQVVGNWSLFFYLKRPVPAGDATS